MRYDARALRAWQDEPDDGGTESIHLLTAREEVSGDTLLAAAGRPPNVQGLGLEEAGVAYTAGGIEVDDRLHTSQRHVYAAGDVIGRHQFTHYAGWQAVFAARNALLPGGSKGIPDWVPWTTFTDPEVAQAGQTEAQARQKYGDQVATHVWPMREVDRARAEGDTAGFLKIVYKRDGALLGATIVAARAGEVIHEWILALDRGLKVDELSDPLHIYPTYSTASWQAAAEIRMQRLLSGTSGRILRGLAHLIR